ncbi:MAG: PAS domain-containing protein [Peptococcaceae bacterium]|nr:PAS domain-containing protein [Peptococcaceae bacterium]
MIKITIIIFCILVMLYFFIARIYWQKEVLNRQLELLSVATSVEQRVEQYLLIYEQDKNLTVEEKTRNLQSLLQIFIKDLSKEKPNVILGYYDNNLKTMLASSTNIQDSIEFIPTQGMTESRVSSFISDSDVVDWDGKGVIGVKVPVIYRDQIMGYSLALIASGDIFYKSYLNYSQVFVPSIVLWILVLLLIKRNIDQIKISLDAFAETIIQESIDNKEELEKLPELKPVYDRIRTHLDSLQRLNVELEESNDKLVTIMEGISDGFLSLDKNWCFTFINEEAKRMTGKEEIDLLGKDLWEELPEIFNSETMVNLRQAMNENQSMHWETSSASGGRYFEIHAYPFVQGLSVFIRDITEFKKQKGELLRLERLNLIGQMAAGISHEVRNPMTTVRGFLQMLESRSDSEQNKEYMEIMISEIDRANGIITDFLSLAKANAECTKHENINGIIHRIFPMIQADAFHSSKDIDLNLGDIPELEVNESEIRQLILNLVRNGLEETPENGKVSISTYLEENYAILAIEDQGGGIPQEVQDKMGTPFITTKETGTGLGLAISIGIAQRHKAKFEFKTGSDGTVFYIKFPLEKA